MNKGFTLIELMTVMIIIAILSSVLFLGKTGEEKKLALQRTAYQLAQDLREVQEMAMGAGEVGCNGIITHSFGVNFNLNKSITSYLLFADCNSDQIYDKDDDTLLRKINLEKEVQISSLLPSPNVLNIVFVPPIPTCFINEEEWGREGVVVVSLKSDQTQQKKVKINSAGRIEVE